MKRFTRTIEHLFSNHQHPELPITPPMRVELGELFELETLSSGDAGKIPGWTGGNPWTGPVIIESIAAGDVIAITIESLQVDDSCYLPLDHGALLPEEYIIPRNDFCEIRDDVAYFPCGFMVPVCPMLGCFGVVPAEFFADPWDHGGNMDITEVRTGATVHVRCSRDGGYFACGDGHALQGEGEINGFSLEVSLTARLRINRSPYQHLNEALIIETPERLMTVGIAHEVPKSIRKAIWAMTDLLARMKGMDTLDAYQLASHVGDVRLGAVWPLWCTRWHVPIPVYLGLDRSLIDWQI